LKEPRQKFGDLEPLLDLLVEALLRDVEAEQGISQARAGNDFEGNSDD
jgi:hypothetical protein